MKPRSWIVPILPIVAVASGWLVAFGLGWWLRHRSAG